MTAPAADPGPRGQRPLAATVLLAALTTMPIAGARDDGQGPSIMFGDTPDARSELTTLPARSEQSRGDRCVQLLREADALKGKPQRRSTAMARYRAECEQP